MTTIEFFVPGIPQPQGSKSVNRATGFMYEDNKRLLPWRADMIGHAVAAMGDTPMITGAVIVDLAARFPRPKSHFGTGRNAGVLKDTAPRFHTQKPDGDKLMRAALDALTIAKVWRDDALVCDLHISRHWADPDEPPGLNVSIETAAPGYASPALVPEYADRLI